ncbi:DUF6318 family protein [Segeticoccus rhizosphaerae]|uniref:DUF6318 family protein n=1 Tax=Segeticoccus rhizosphaerae TaxID=1104777 RepID=UPI001264F48D|nr:DUF6318 family protein [Segeticoccus rhizosphaerae]
MGTRSNRYAVLAAGALLGSALLAGCGGDEKPSPPPTGGGTVAGGPTTAPPTNDPTGTTTPSDPATSSSPRPTKGTEEAGAPGVPKAARQHTNKGAEAFVRYYNQQLNIAWSKPKTGLLKPLSLPSCKTCAAYEGTARDSEKRDRHLDGPVSRLADVQITPATKTGSILATATQRLLRRSVVDSSGNVKDRTKAKTIFPETELKWTGDGWRVAEIRLLQ